MPFGCRFGHKSRIFKTPRALCPDYPTWEVYIGVPVGKKIEWKALKKELTRQSHGKVEVIIYIRCQTMVDVEKQQAVGVKRKFRLTE